MSEKGSNTILWHCKKAVIPLIALFFFLMAWEFAVRLFSVSPLIIPSPLDVAAIFVKRLPYLFWHAALTLSEAALGYLLAVTGAISLAMTFQFSKTVEKAVYPYAKGLIAIPLVALAPIVTLWCGSGMPSKVILAAIISFFPILVNSVQGLNTTEPEALDLMRSFSASKWQTIYYLRFPSALGSIFAGLKIASTFSVIGAVVAEFIASDRGIGYIIKSSSYYLDTSLTFSAILMSALTGLFFFKIVTLLEKRVVFWQANGVAGGRERARRNAVRARAELLRTQLKPGQDAGIANAVFFRGFKLQVQPGVFSPAFGEGTQLLADYMDVRKGETVLDVGTGSGALAILAAEKASKVVAVDISLAAVECARENAARLGMADKIDVRQGNLFETLSKDEKFDLIVFNPPFYKGMPEFPSEGAIFDDGYQTLARFFSEVWSCLAEGGHVLLAFSSVGDMEHFQKLMKASPCKTQVLAEAGESVKYYVFKLERSHAVG